jgi:hypothetical protein
MVGNNSLAKVLLLSLIVSGISSCNKSSFSAIDPNEKSKVISQDHVFDSNGQDNGYGTNNPNGRDPGFQQPNPSGTDGAGRMPNSVPSLPTITPAPVSPTPINGVPSPTLTPTQPPVTQVPPAPVDPNYLPPTFPISLLPPQLNLPSTPVTYPPIPDSPTHVPFYFICSNSDTESLRVNFITATSLKVRVIQYIGGKRLTAQSWCDEDAPDIAAQIKASKSITFSKCQPKGTYISTSDLSSGQTSAGKDYFTVDVIANGTTSLLSERNEAQNNVVKILFDANSWEPRPVYPPLAENQVLCDDHASPLFVDMRNEYEKTKSFSLRAPWDGVWFDILGQNADTPHYPNRISWFDSAAMAYIALPNRYGQVLGIDQLFGDNTLGPDGKFASNGYQALAKYDSNKDGVISDEDAVYSKLRIWQDINHDGKAQASELKSLADAQLAVIDLNYDSSFAEQDIYGNTVKYKSVAKTTAGGYRLVFDIWFELNLYKARARYSLLSR